MTDKQCREAMRSAWYKRADELAHRRNLCDAYEAGFIDAWSALSAAPSPDKEPVSLERCAEAAYDKFRDDFELEFVCFEMAKAVLKAAGVKYVD
jgi:hypothetical protein